MIATYANMWGQIATNKQVGGLFPNDGDGNAWGDAGGQWRLGADGSYTIVIVDNQTAAYWLALVLALGTIALAYAVLRSRQGLALAAIRGNEGAAGSIGVDAFRTKVGVFVVSAFGTGLVGALIYLQKARVSPDAAFSLLDWTANVIFIVVIGGIGTIEGPIVGVLVFTVLQSWLAGFGAWYLMLLGAVALGVMLFFPRDLWGTLADRYDIALFPIRRRLRVASGPAADPRR